MCSHLIYRNVDDSGITNNNGYHGAISTKQNRTIHLVEINPNQLLKHRTHSIDSISTSHKTVF